MEIEVDRLDQFRRAIEAGPDIILLDNMSGDQLREAVSWRNSNHPHVLLLQIGDAFFKLYVPNGVRAALCMLPLSP